MQAIYTMLLAALLIAAQPTPGALPQPPRRASIPFVHHDRYDVNGWRETAPSFALDPTGRLQLLLMRKRGNAPVANNTPHGYGYSVHCTSCELVTARASADGRAWPQPTVALLLPADAADAAATKRGIISAVGWFSRSGATVAVAPGRRQIHLFMAKFINSSTLGTPDAHEGALATMYSRGDWDPFALRWNYSVPRQVLRDDDNGSPLNALVLPSGRVLFAHAASPGGSLPKGIIYDQQIYTVFSDDQGISWHRSATRTIIKARGGGLCEPSLLVHRKSGELWMPMRSQTLHTLWQSRSIDGGGNNWSAPQPTGSGGAGGGSGLPLFVSHRSHMIPLQLRDGRLVVFWPNGLTTNETYPTRQMSHAALSTDAGRSFSGYREVAREVFSNQGTDETGPDHGAGGATRPVETGVDGRLLIAAGQGAHTQLLYTMDVDWLLQKRQIVDFTRVKSIANAAAFDGSFVSTEGTAGVRLCTAPVENAADGNAVQALRLRRANAIETAGVWNFPAAATGELQLTVLWASADARLSLALSDFYSAPADAAMETANSSCIFQLPAATVSSTPRPNQPMAGQWHSVRVHWSPRAGGGFQCTIQLDDGKPATTMHSTRRLETEGQLSYVRLRATGKPGSDVFILNMTAGVTGVWTVKTDDTNAGRVERRPSILFATYANTGTGSPAWNGYIDPSFVAYLMNGTASDSGVEVDFLDSMNDFNSTRLVRYNAVVLFVSPHAVTVGQHTSKEDVPSEIMRNETINSFTPVIEEFVRLGGGVFLFPSETGWFTQQLPELYNLFEVSLPTETLTETNASNHAQLDHILAGTGQLAYTDSVSSHPVTAGVRGAWYPTHAMFAAGFTGPVLPIGNWSVLLRASATTVTQVVNYSSPGEQKRPPPCATSSCRGRVPGQAAPALFAVRNFAAGRVAILSQWRQFTTGSGSHWLFDNQVLHRGAAGRPSDMGRLLRNCLVWLSHSPGSNLGGFVTPAERWVPRNEAPSTANEFSDTTYNYNVTALETVSAAQLVPSFRGLIGARTILSDGHGSVHDFAVAATAVGIDFIVFLETFALSANRTLSAASLDRLTHDCVAPANSQIQLIPGFTIENQMSNHMFVFGHGVSLPSADMLTADGRRFAIMAPDPAAPMNMTGFANGKAFTWLLEGDSTAQCDATGQAPDGVNVGYFGLGRSNPNGLKMYDLRVFSMAAVKYYDCTGQLVEELTDDFKETQESTVGPIPVVIDRVGSPAELSASVTQNHAATFVKAKSKREIFCSGLRWQDFFDLPTFVSNGPVIHVWSQTARNYVLGAEKFVTGRALMSVPIWIAPRPGGPPLAEIKISNGRELYRRFVLNISQSEERPFMRTLLLDGFVHRNLVLEVTDAAGNTALSNAARSWKPGAIDSSIEFCGDHVNDCGMNLLGHGPHVGAVSNLPTVANPGTSWDGGPPATIHLLRFSESRPVLKTVGGGGQDSTRCMQTPHLESSDEGMIAVTEVQDRIFASSVEAVVPDETFGPYGPSAGVTPLMSTTLRYRLFSPPTVGVPVTSYPGFGEFSGAMVSIFRSEMMFKTTAKVQELRVLYDDDGGPAVPVCFVAAASAAHVQPVVVEMSRMGVRDSEGWSFIQRIEPGGWFAAWSNLTAQASIFFVRGTQPLLLQMRSGPQPQQGSVTMYQLSAANVTRVAKGEQLVFELASLGTSLRTSIASLADVLRLVDYLTEPTAVEVLRGSRLVGPQYTGLLELRTDNAYVAELTAGHYPDQMMMLPVRVHGFVRRWTVGFWQVEGYTLGHYGNGSGRYTELGMSADNLTHIPLYVGLAAKTHARIGHPVVCAGARAEQVFIQVTSVRVGNGSAVFHVALNNPSDVALALTCVASFPEVGLPRQTLMLQSGEHRVLKSDDAALATVTSFDVKLHFDLPTAHVEFAEPYCAW
jgi:hypothetical protein